MTTFPNFDEFYHCIIPIGEADQRYLQSKLALSNNYTNWLIALEGNHDLHCSSTYHWNVSIYLADKQGSFSFRQPFFNSPSYRNFNHAYDRAKEYLYSGKCDALTNSLPI